MPIFLVIVIVIVNYPTLVLTTESSLVAAWYTEVMLFTVFVCVCGLRSQRNRQTLAADIS